MRQRLERDGATTWPLPVELAALRVEGIAHVAWIVTTDAGGAARARLCVEAQNGRLDAATVAALRAAIAPAPVDEVVALARIPRDPRHASKTDTGALLERLRARA